MTHECKVCGGVVSDRVLPVYNAARMIGAPFPVLLRDVAEERFCANCQRVDSVLIPRLEELISSAAVIRAVDPIKLSGSDIKFLRGSLDMQAKDFAVAIDIDKATLSRFENDKQTVSDAVEHRMRSEAILGHFEIAHELGFSSDEMRKFRRFTGPRPIDNLFEVRLTYGVRDDPKEVSGGGHLDDPFWRRPLDPVGKLASKIG